jgi:enediyne biosynthesis protein CalE5
MSGIVDNPKAAIKTSWGAAAEGWDQWFRWYERNFQPVVAWCCDAAALRPGASLLDIACGTGQLGLAAARRVLPGGRVVATDIAPEMVEVARRRAVEAGLSNVEVREADAENLPFPDNSFDAVTFAFALMFCPDLDRAVAEMRRVLKPGGRAAVVVWDEASKNPFFTTIGHCVGKFLPSAPPNPTAPGPFRLAPPGALARLLSDGGFADVQVESVPMTIECASIDEYWDSFTDHAVGVKVKLAQLSDADLAALRAEVSRAAAPHVVDGRVRLLATPLCASARR